MEFEGAEARVEAYCAVCREAGVVLEADGSIEIGACHVAGVGVVHRRKAQK